MVGAPGPTCSADAAIMAGAAAPAIDTDIDSGGGGGPPTMVTTGGGVGGRGAGTPGGVGSG